MDLLLITLACNRPLPPGLHGPACRAISRPVNIFAFDLARRPPRSVRVRLGGYALLPRMLDKSRAELTGKQGGFHYACPNDQRILQFLGIDPDALKAEVARGGGDGEILEWIRANRENKHTPAEIEAWSESMDRRRPTAEDRSRFDEYLAECGPARTDITCWPDLLDLDDFVSFGGRA